MLGQVFEHVSRLVQLAGDNINQVLSQLDACTLEESPEEMSGELVPGFEWDAAAAYVRSEPRLPGCCTPRWYEHGPRYNDTLGRYPGYPLCGYGYFHAEVSYQLEMVLSERNQLQVCDQQTLEVPDEA